MLQAKESSLCLAGLDQACLSDTQFAENLQCFAAGNKSRMRGFPGTSISCEGFEDSHFLSAKSSSPEDKQPTWDLSYLIDYVLEAKLHVYSWMRQKWVII